MPQSDSENWNKKYEKSKINYKHMIQREKSPKIAETSENEKNFFLKLTIKINCIKLNINVI